MQATESDEQYPKLTIFNVVEGQMERFVANFVQFLRNSPFSGELYTLHDFSPLQNYNSERYSKKWFRQALHCPSYSTLVTRSPRIHRYWTLFLVQKIDTRLR